MASRHLVLFLHLFRLGLVRKCFLRPKCFQLFLLGWLYLRKLFSDLLCCHRLWISKVHLAPIRWLASKKCLRAQDLCQSTSPTVFCGTHFCKGLFLVFLTNGLCRSCRCKFLQYFPRLMAKIKVKVLPK